MSNSSAIYALCLIATIACFSNVFAGRMTQFYTVYEETNCRGNSRNFTRSTYGISFYSWSRILNGVWRTRQVNSGRYMFSVYPYGYGCSEYMDWGRTQVKDVEKLHPYDFDDPALSVSEHYLFDTGTYLFGPSSAVAFFESPKRIESWAVTGTDSYILTSSTGLNPTSICIEPSYATKVRGYGITFDYSISPPLVVQIMQRVTSCPPGIKVAHSNNTFGDFFVEFSSHDTDVFKPNLSSPEKLQKFSKVKQNLSS